MLLGEYEPWEWRVCPSPPLIRNPSSVMSAEVSESDFYRPEPDLSGGMIPAVAPPFAMTRWAAQTRQNCELPIHLSVFISRHLDSLPEVRFLADTMFRCLDVPS
jgi:hypothetical protein